MACGMQEVKVLKKPLRCLRRQGNFGTFIKASVALSKLCNTGVKIAIEKVLKAFPGGECP